MIAYLDIEAHAENPQLPIGPCMAFVGSPSNVRILKVPKGIGSWKIDAVAVAFTRPDNSITTVNAVNVAGCWVATLPASAVGGRCDKGFQIEASGTDENGNAVSGYVLGVGDTVILPRDGTATSDGVQYYFHYRDAVPTTPRKGDVCVIDGALKWYDGSAWQAFGADVEIVAPSTNPADAGKAADAKATGDALAGKASTADATLTPVYSQTPTYSGWTILRGDVDVTSQVGQPVFSTEDPDFENVWLCEGCLVDSDSFDGFPIVSGAQDATSLSWEARYEDESGSLVPSPQYTATRTRTDIIGYTLGSQSTKPLAALDDRNFAPVYSASATYAVGALCVHGGMLYRCSTPIASAEAWNAAHWTATDVKTELAGKQDAIDDLAAIRSGAAAGATAYQKPQAGIPASDMASGVQTSLGKADTAVQPSALAGAVRYNLGMATVISAASTDTSVTPNIDYGSATLADRTANLVAVRVALDELRLTFPAAVSDKVRDFGLRVTVDNSEGSAAIDDIALPEPTPTGTETLTFVTSDGAMPKIAGAAAGETATTILYFSEVSPSVFLVKGEEVKEVA